MMITKEEVQKFLNQFHEKNENLRYCVNTLL